MLPLRGMLFARFRCMDNFIRFVGLSGSLRKDSLNTKLLRNVSTLLPENVAFNIVSFAELPVYNADEDVPAVSQRPASVTAFRNELAKADGLVIVSPEYNYSIPGGLKNAIDWASRGDDSPLMKKPVALMGATPGPWGTVRMQMAFLPLFLYLEMKPVWKPEVLVASATGKFDTEGKLIDEMAIGLIRKKLQGLKEIIVQQHK